MMAKIRTVDQLQVSLDKEMSWRIKEISTFRLASKEKGEGQSVFVRAGVALVYAHWEGFIKNSSEFYLNYVSCQGLSYSQLATCFTVFGLKAKLDELSASKSASSNRKIIEFILDSRDEVAKMQLKGAIRTESNLKSRVFDNILNSLGLSSENYEAKYNLIDESLLKRRNSIAHGEYMELSQREFQLLADEIIGIMRNFKNDIENAASLSLYQKGA